MPKLVSARLKAQPAPGQHPAPELLNAFAENALSEVERGHLLQHLGACRDCREILYLALPESAATQAVLVPQSRPFRRWALSWGALVASVAIVAVLFTSTRLAHKNQAARLATPASATEPNVAEEKAPGEFDQFQAVRNARPSQTPAILAKNEKKAQPEAKHMTAKLQPGLVFEQSGEVRVQAPARQSDVAAGLAGKERPRDEDKNKNEGETEWQKGGAGLAGIHGTATGAGSAGKLGDLARSSPQVPESRTDQPARGQLQADSAILPSPAPPSNPPSSSPPNSSDSSSPNSSSPNNDLALPVRSDLKVQSSSEAVEVQAAAQELAPNSYSQSTHSKSVNAALVARKAALAVPKWSLTSAGEVQRSLDRGKTWVLAQPVSGIVFRAISSVGPEVWAAGNRSALYYSADSGLTWTPLIVKADGKDLHADFTAIEFTDALHGRLKTATGGDFSTSDGGRNWLPQVAH